VVKRVVFAIPGKLDIPTGGYVYDRRILRELRALGWNARALRLGEDFPFPSAETRVRAHAALAALPDNVPVVIDGLAFGALPETAAQLGASRRLIALVHHPLALETGLPKDLAEKLRISEVRALSFTRRVIVTSAATKRLIVSDYGVAIDRVSIAQPGSDQVERSTGGSEAYLNLLAVGAVSTRKGYDILLAALAPLIDLPWRLIIVGDLTRDVGAVARLAEDIARLDLSDRVTLAGAVSERRLATLYGRADLFALASRFEGFGMAYAEAIAHGLPIVGTSGGAIGETVPADACLLAPPGDVAAFSTLLRRLMEDPVERRRRADAAWSAAGKLQSWRRSGELFSQAIEAAR
jgi:glycosyltransferase involved in cell wall biosynthesis